jgi:hypothetical protein
MWVAKVRIQGDNEYVMTIGIVDNVKVIDIDQENNL